MERSIKKILIKMLILLLNGLKALGYLLLGLFRILALPFVWIWKLGLRRLVFLIYRLILRLKIATGTLLAPFRKTLLAAFSHRYVVHGMMILIVLFVAVKSLTAHDAKAGTESTQSLFYQLLPDSAFGTDESPAPNNVVALDANATETTETGVDVGLNYDQSGVITPIVLPAGNAKERVMISKPEKYVVQDGDTISEIAANYGIGINTILWANNMTARSLLRVGQELTILPVDGVLHTVKKNETVSAIAKQFGTSVDKIMAANRVTDVSQIQIGENLIIPDGKPPAPPAFRLPSRFGSVKDVFYPPSEAPRSRFIDGTQLAWPTDQHHINQYFHYGHPGVDINGNPDNVVYAADDGIVTYAGWNSGGYGNMTLIDSGNGIITRYGHQSKFFVRVGDQVKKGQSIGMIGSTGHSTGPHLHFEIYLGGVRRNPLEFYK